MLISSAWRLISTSKDGEIYELMKVATEDIKNGIPEADAIFKFGIYSNTPEVKKFASSLVQGIETDASNLGQLLASSSTEMWNLKKQVMLQKGEKAASQLLVPVSLIFVGILIVVVAAAVGILVT